MPRSWDDDEDDHDFDAESTQVTSRPELAAHRLAQGTPERPWIVVVAGAASIGRMYKVEPHLDVGRSSDAHVHIEEDGVSRRHARLELLADGRTQISDLGSRNGTFVNGVRVTGPQVLQDGDKIQIGETTILKLSYLDTRDEALQQNLYQSATRDPLTQLANRRAFTEALERETAFARRQGTPLSLVAFDVDHFKRVNDAYGHPAGDHVLRRLGQVVAGCLRKEDIVARVGGEEFAILLRNIQLPGAHDCAERVRRTVEITAFEHGGQRIPVTISLGVATFNPAAPPTEGLVEVADRCLYAAKQGGRNRVALRP